MGLLFVNPIIEQRRQLRNSFFVEMLLYPSELFIAQCSLKQIIYERCPSTIDRFDQA